MIGTAALLFTSILGVAIDANPAEPAGRCVEYYHTALRTGWSADQWPMLDRIIYRESRCITTACGETDRPDLRRCRDWGIMQINDYSWKTDVRAMRLEMDDLFDPYWNLFVARWLYDTAERIYGCGWQPWSIECETER
jgi:hypothetical protein